jgi:hypothetical protein
MTWARKFAPSIELKDGRTIATLAEARAIMLSLSERRRRSEHWLYAGELLREAATTKGALGRARAQLSRALEAEGLI